MPEEISGRGVANNPSIATDQQPGQSLDADRQATILSAQRRVEKAEANLKDAKEELANAKKGMN